MARLKALMADRLASDASETPQYAIYPPELDDPWRGRRFAVGEALYDRLGIPREEAGAYIRRYFERSPGIRDYMEATKKACREQGYVTTIFGRKCHYPRITASNPSERAFNERAAINAPIQGSAADIIRRAMVRMEDALAEKKLSAQMLLQVHDELVLEAPPEEVSEVRAMVKSEMESVRKFEVPLLVETGVGTNWRDAK